ncbi:zinc-ribbon domain-containing protein [Flavobacterium limnosediminis]|uniref:zinc-ribbon domain-containing protein n=1 Tax=Flavobacterium limnosediminis TaxID=1401027 RepID=UPI00041DB9E0|nr:zinc-ribbon domain-containing protein [Flavobacterium limnosediminis]
MTFHLDKIFKVLKRVQIDNYSCGSCNKKTNLDLIIKGGYITLLFIPMLPLKKDYTLTCFNCGKRIKKSDLNYIEKEKVVNEFNSTRYKVPFRHFSGILIVLTILGFAINTGVQMKKKEKEYILKPNKKDVYLIKNNFGYTTYKVQNVTSDSIFVYKNNFIVDHFSKIKSIDVDTNYKILQGFKLSEVIKMYNSNIIYEINRKEP